MFTKPFLSIKWRLALQFSLTVLLILGISGGLVLILFTQKAQRDIDTLLFVQYTNLQSSLEQRLISWPADGSVDEIFQEINAKKRIDLVSVVVNREGKVLERTSQEKISLPWNIGYSNGWVDAQPYRFYMGEERGLRVIVGQNLENLGKTTQALTLILLVVLGAMFLLAFSLSALFAKRALAPLRLLHDRVSAIRPPHLPGIPLASAYPAADEIGQLAQTFDAFLKKLAQAFERERQFTQDASHELRTPLTVMKTSLELLVSQSDGLSNSQRDKLETLDRAIRQMEQLVNDLLLLSRGTETPAEKKTLDLGNFLKTFSKPFTLLATQKGLDFKFQVVKDFTVRLSPLALEKIVGNLIKNALAFTEKGAIAIEIDDPAIRVRDTGIGIAAQDLPHLFERFYQANPSRTSEGKGFGLGLAIAQGMAQREGWRITVESQPGKGSVFTVWTA